MNSYSNIRKISAIGDPFWERTQAAGMSGVVAKNRGDGLMEVAGKAFINMCSYSYLGLDSNPKILEGSIAALREAGTLNSSTSRVRIKLSLLDEVESSLSELYSLNALTTSSCASAASAVLPLLAAGVLTENTPPLMVFDRSAHFCLSLMKPICADETQVLTSAHNDLEFLEDCCRKNARVVYVADGVYSTGGVARIKELMMLQEKYGLFVLYDEAHGLSIKGKNGCGVVLEEMGGLNANTMLIVSLNKGFGGSGGAIFFDDSIKRSSLLRFGGPLSWSQRINTAGLGAILASIQIHASNEISVLQARLADNISRFDELVPSAAEGDGLPIRLIPMLDEVHAISAAQELMRQGFYTSPLFYPVVPKNTPGLRIMLRANLQDADLVKFCTAVRSVL
ncbi:MAG TPA: aminotransferase class I/II-fold pyridoxal phosphate-dependent enzyme [Pseudomonas lactis]|uniref:Aminotransferase class I/II-fold pyridoxal phosphate-dependent enzyme n=1 Tax=Pseudomonas lactis TaxID=1615674 RepID=A0A921NEA8_9PSED|nr:aminotransferase class I/II-fold pyridoxal phosphate-dependent enzyme [Pseudomonas lactis]HJH17321.1 aminotransferase class I/II-fold pyridoxal phosphate-dependent enzyme [Pseudomonas lactis]